MGQTAKLTKAQQQVIDYLTADPSTRYIKDGDMSGPPKICEGDAPLQKISQKVLDSLCNKRLVVRGVRRIGNKRQLTESVLCHTDSVFAAAWREQVAEQDRQRQARQRERAEIESNPAWQAADHVVGLGYQSADELTKKYPPEALIQAAKLLGWKGPNAD